MSLPSGGPAFMPDNYLKPILQRTCKTATYPSQNNMSLAPTVIPTLRLEDICQPIDLRLEDLGQQTVCLCLKVYKNNILRLKGI